MLYFMAEGTLQSCSMYLEVEPQNSALFYKLVMGDPIRIEEMKRFYIRFQKHLFFWTYI